MSAEQGTPNAGAADPNTTQRRGLDAVAKGGGNWFDANKLPARGAEYRVVGTDFAPNFKKDAQTPVIIVQANGGEAMRLRVNSRTSAQKLLDAGVKPDLEGAVGMTVYLIPVRIQVGGAEKTIAQIAEVNRPA